MTIAVAMSGGVDSSVAATLLTNAGYEVIGLTMHLWDYDAVGGNVRNEASCCSLETMDDARAVCHRIGIPHYVIDVREEFRNIVIANFISEYLNGRTPNPCILCNYVMKWSVLYRKAVQLGASLLATGHYAQVGYDNRYLLKKGKDRAKDQSYALWALTQEQLQHTRLPLGELTKQEVRQIADKFALKTKDKKESQDICFIPDNDYGRFLNEHAPAATLFSGMGEIRDLNGNILGHHRGYPYFTIGQRKGLGIAVGKPRYVVDIDAAHNRIIVGEKSDLSCKRLVAKNVNWIAIPAPGRQMEVIAQIRYNDTGKAAVIYPEKNGEVLVEFNETHQAVTPGQSVVFYDGDIVIGGGVIDRRADAIVGSDGINQQRKNLLTL